MPGTWPGSVFPERVPFSYHKHQKKEGGFMQYNFKRKKKKKLLRTHKAQTQTPWRQNEIIARGAAGARKQEKCRKPWILSYARYRFVICVNLF